MTDAGRRITRAEIVALPKAELHLHLEATLRPATAAELADRLGRPVPRTGHFADLAEFVGAYEGARDLLGTLDDLRRVARELIEDAGRLGVVWSEVHLIPPTYAGRLGPAEGIVEAVLDGFGGAAGIILGINRGLPVAAAEESLRLALAYHDRGVVGLGLAGDEARHPAARFSSLFGRARAAGLSALPHAGEGAGAASVRACVEHLGARRINHGVRAVEDPTVLDLLRERNVVLDVCPSSNVALGVAASIDEHPLPTLLAAGVGVTLASDAPYFCDTDIVAEYLLAHERLGVDRAGLAAIARRSLVVSSCPRHRLPRPDPAIRPDNC